MTKEQLNLYQPDIKPKPQQSGWAKLHTQNKLILLLILTTLILFPAVNAQTALSVTVSTNKTQYSPGETVSLSGAVHDNQNSAVFGASVSIQVNGPGNKFVYAALLYTDQSGAYSSTFIIPANSDSGQYPIYVTASKSGYENAQTQMQFSVQGSSVTTSSSQTSSATSSGPKCFIATAAYGSELSPEVTSLRNFRDLNVLRTSVGESFMQAFNAFYYSFSPQAASYISTNNNLRAVMQVLLYPLVSILSISSMMFAATSLNGELAVVLSGIFASFSLGAVYIGPIATALLLAFRSAKLRCLKALRVTAKMTIVFLPGLVIAEVTHLDSLLMFTSVGIVLTFVALGSLLVPRIVLRRLD